MKKRKLKTLCLFLVIVVMLSGITLNNVSAKAISEKMSAEVTTYITDKIEAKTKQVVVDDFGDIQNVSMDYSNSLGIDKNDMKNISIGNPFIIYSLSDSNQSEIYYYPIIDNRDNKVVITVDVMKMTDSWTYSIGTEYVEYLNKINYTNSEYIFYSYGDYIYSDDGNKSIVLYGNGNETGKEKVKAFQQLDCSKKIEAISNRISTFEQKKNNDLQPNNAFERRMTYTPTMTGNTCQLYNPVGQGNYGLCWAASVATIVNYRKGTNLTATNVADAEGVGYDEGGTLTNATNCLHRYGLTDYSAVNRTLSWSQLYDNIMKFNKPFYMACYYDSTESGHAVVCFGCNEISSNQYIVIWNPGNNNGNGGSTMLKYYPNATAFAYANKTWVWYDTVSSYN